MIGHIFIIGIIGDDTGIPGPSINLLDVVTQLHANKDATELSVIVDSKGGRCDLGYEINALLRAQNKPITTIIKGTCASIATVIAMAGDVRLIEEGSQFMIHNPWGGTEGDADHLEAAAADIRAQEDKMIAFYHKATGIAKESLDALMKQETFLSAEKAVELGFLTGTIQKQRAVALLNKDEMSASIKEMSESLKKMGADIMAAITKGPVKVVVKALAVTGGDGVIYTVTPSDGVEDGLVEVGDVVSLPDGSMANGDIVMPDGSVVKVAEGKVSEIVPAATATDAPKVEEPSALEKENEELKSQVLALTQEAETAKSFMNDLKVQQTEIMAALRNTTSSYKPPVSTPVFAAGEAPKEEKNAFADAAERRKANNK
jgi:ATP-dependent protease ClpP protease subunit